MVMVVSSSCSVRGIPNVIDNLSMGIVITKLCSLNVAMIISEECDNDICIGD